MVSGRSLPRGSRRARRNPSLPAGLTYFNSPEGETFLIESKTREAYSDLDPLMKTDLVAPRVRSFQ